MEEQNEIKIQTRFLENPWKVFFWEAFLFFLTLGLGIGTTWKASSILERERISLPEVSFYHFLFSFILVNVFVIFLLFFSSRLRKGALLKILFLFSLGFSILLLINTWIPNILSFVLTFLLIFLWLKKPSVLTHDLVMVFAMAGAGSILGLRMNPKIVIALLILFSIYDFIAVYKTKHMIKMAKEMMKKGAIAALIVPAQISDFKGKLEQVKPGGRFLILGGGDVVFPLLFCSSLISEGVLSSLIVAFFSVFGLLASFLIFALQKERKPIPALPPIALFSIIGYLVTLIM